MTDGGNRLSIRADYWRYFAGEAAKDGDSPLYAHLSLAIADDPAMQAVTLPAKPGQPPANMLFGAVHFVLLGGAEHPLRRHYSHLLKPGETEAPIGPDTYAVFSDFVAAHRSAIDELIAARVTNTNEVRRCSYLRAGYAEIAARTAQPLSIVEIGPSAGLNLNWDRYAYRYIGEGGALTGGETSALMIECEWRGDRQPPVPAAHPAVARRGGLELNPVDLASEEDRRWLLSLLWPGRPERIARMKAALDIAERHPPPIRSGNALDLLPQTLAAADASEALVVTHSLVTYQWNEPMWQRLDEILRQASHVQPIHRLFADRVEKDDPATLYPLRLWTYAGGAVDRQIVAQAHHHGAWIEWLA